MAKADISIKAGALRHLCHILQPVTGAMGITGPTTNYVPFAQFVPAAIEPASARDMIRSGQTVSETIIPVTIRWMPNVSLPAAPGVLANFRVQFVRSWQGNYSVVSQYEVQGIIEVDERSWKVTLACIALALNQ
jgi:head-tail adaptor